MAPKAVVGREAVVRAMEQYYESGGLQDSSQLPRARYTILKESGMSVGDIARAECVFGLALNGNSVPAAFWVVWDVFSDAAVLSRVRQEVQGFISTAQNTGEGVQTLTLDLRRIKEALYLHAVIHETLRYRARGTGPRMVLEDVIISSNACEYHVEKGSTLILANESMHHDTAVWGPNADTLFPDRFSLGTRSPPTAFVALEGDPTSAPESLGGRWDEPGQDLSNMARENLPPLKKVMVDVAPRKGTENVVWRYVL
ncbi:cytochrome P450 [Periconia macrospinosa]|uniref:Cytochrome P450 n=1 Tax=Periconia macrospinosa TaxID=97972 RepID=A0A2V1DDF9_9PLEO|nr:cytochrome P450 [Periconia macrospinosa]